MKKHLPRDLLLVAVALFLWGLGEGMFASFQVIYLKQLGADPVLTGAILSGVGIWMTVAQIPAGYLSDRIGPRPGMWAAWILGALATVGMALSGSLLPFVVSISLYGLTAFVSAPLNSYATAARGEWSLERALTFPSAMYNVGMALGALAGGQVAGAFGIQRIYVVAAVIFVISTLVILQARPAPPHEAHPSSHAAAQPNLVKNPRFLGLLALILISMFAAYLPQPLTPNFLQNQAGLSYQTIGLLGALGAIGNAVISLALHGLRAPLAFAAGQLLVGVYALLLWRGGAVAWYALAYFFVGGYRLSRAMTFAYARQFVRASEVGLAYGLVETANSAVIIAAPFAAGLLYSANPYLVYPVSLTAILAMAALNLGLKRRLTA